MKIRHWKFDSPTEFLIIPATDDPSSRETVDGAVFLVQMTEEEYAEFAQRMIMKAALTPLQEMFTRVTNNVLNTFDQKVDANKKYGKIAEDKRDG